MTGNNNLVENAIRPLAIGRKNYLFAGSHEAAERAAVIYSLLGTCKLHGVNPQEWLTDVLNRIPAHPAKHVAELLPHRWKAAQQAAASEAACSNSALTALGCRMHRWLQCGT